MFDSFFFFLMLLKYDLYYAISLNQFVDAVFFRQFFCHIFLAGIITTAIIHLYRNIKFTFDFF